MWIVIAGDFFDGLREVVGPFDTYEKAEEYMESHNMGHAQKSVVEMINPTAIKPIEPRGIYIRGGR